MSTLIATDTNVVFAALIRELFPNSPEIGFTTWIALGLPLTAVFSPLIWLALLRYAVYLGLGQVQIPVEAARKMVSEKLAELGHPSRGEKTIVIAFMITVCLWVFRKPILVGELFMLPCWSPLFSADHANIFARYGDSGIYGGIALCDPSRFQNRYFCDGLKDGSESGALGYRLADGRRFCLGDGFRRLAGGAFEHPAQCAHLDDDPGDLRVNDLCDRIYLEYQFDHHYAPNSGRVGAEHGGETSVADRTGNAVGFVRLYDAGRDPAQRDFFSSGWIEIRQMAQVGFFLNVLGIL